MTQVTELPVRYADTDAQGVVFFANYLTYMDEGLTALLDGVGSSYARLEEQGVDLVYADARCSFRSSARFGDTVQVVATEVELGNTSLKTSWELRRGDEVLAIGQLVSVCLDHATRRPRSLPEPLRRALQGG